MRCSKCDNGNLRVRDNHYEDGIYIRTRVCDSCGYRTKTAEINYEIYKGLAGFIELIKKLAKSL